MGAIQEKYTLADVICQHKTDGTIIPLKIRITDEDGEYQVYNIKSYKDVEKTVEAMERFEKLFK